MMRSIWGLVLVMAMLPAAFAEDGGDDDWMKGRLFSPELLLQHRAELKLTDAQRDVMRKELIALQAKSAEIDFEMLDSATEVQTLLDKHPIDSKAVLAETGKMLSTESRKKILFLEMLINIKNQLTPSQIQIAKELDAK